MARGAHYPLTAVLGYDLFDLLSKDHLAALVVDLHRAQLGEDVATGERIRAEVAARLDILAAAGQVPRSLPARYPRHRDDLAE